MPCPHRVLVLVKFVLLYQKETEKFTKKRGLISLWFCRPGGLKGRALASTQLLVKAFVLDQNMVESQRGIFHVGSQTSHNQETLYNNLLLWELIHSWKNSPSHVRLRTYSLAQRWTAGHSGGICPCDLNTSFLDHLLILLHWQLNFNMTLDVGKPYSNHSRSHSSEGRQPMGGDK